MIFTSGRPRSHQSAAALAPHAELTADPLFVEAPLASPPLPWLAMRVTKWAVVSRLLWHLGFHPGNRKAARRRCPRGSGCRYVDRTRAQDRRHRAGGAWLFQLDDRPPTGTARLSANRKPSSALLEHRHL
jgi:hypothetical protein